MKAGTRQSPSPVMRRGCKGAISSTLAPLSSGKVSNELTTPPPPPPSPVPSPRKIEWQADPDEAKTPSDELVDAKQAQRHEEVNQEVQRILSFDPRSFPSLVDWGFAVLGVNQHDIISVQRAYRAVMKKLHPDKAEQSPVVTHALERFHEAKRLCERSLLQQEPPAMPRLLRLQALCTAVGRRRFLLEWAAPEQRQAAPVLKYVVALHDAATGRVTRITEMEPDYSAELGRFVTIEELRNYELVEEELKIPGLFQEPSITILLAAANKAGQSDWMAARIHLSAAPTVPAQVPVAAVPTPIQTVMAKHRPATVLRQRSPFPR